LGAGTLLVDPDVCNVARWQGQAAMIKIMIFIRKKDGLSRDEFIDYYENRHVPLINSRVGQFLTGYIRNYIDPDAALGASSGSGRVEGDVITDLLVGDEP